MKTADERAWDAIKSIRAHFAAHLDVAREDGNADQERGARALLEDLDVLRMRVEYEADRIAAAIEADRAQREHPMSDPLIELREWASTVSQFMAEDKSNDWREEIAQLQVIEERLDGEA